MQDEGCTVYDLYSQVVKNYRWSQFNTYDTNQQRYHEAVDSLQQLCSNIEPGLISVSEAGSSVYVLYNLRYTTLIMRSVADNPVLMKQ